jgi:hypothetical protein
VSLILDQPARTDGKAEHLVCSRFVLFRIGVGVGPRHRENEWFRTNYEIPYESKEYVYT